jgi:hypothetical protein
MQESRSGKYWVCDFLWLDSENSVHGNLREMSCSLHGALICVILFGAFVDSNYRSVSPEFADTESSRPIKLKCSP